MRRKEGNDRTLVFDAHPFVEQVISGFKKSTLTGYREFFHSIKGTVDVLHEVNGMGSEIPKTGRLQKTVSRRWFALSPEGRANWDKVADMKNKVKNAHHPEDVFE